MIEERGFRLGRVLTAVRLGFIVDLIGCGFSGFVCGLTWRALAASTIINYADNVLYDDFSEPVNFSSWES